MTRDSGKLDVINMFHLNLSLRWLLAQKVLQYKREGSTSVEICSGWDITFLDSIREDVVIHKDIFQMRKGRGKVPWYWEGLEGVKDPVSWISSLQEHR